MNKKLISLVLALLMLVSLFPMAVLADKAEASEKVTAPAYEESPYTPGPEGDEDVAVMVYGKSIADAVYKADYSFTSFVNALKSELQGILANEKLPDVELYLVNDKNQEYKLTKNAVEDAAFLSSFQYHADGILGWTEYVMDFVKTAFGWLISDIDTVGEFYKIYGAENVPEGDYTLEVRRINGDGYTLWQPESGKTRVHVGDDHVNYVGYDQEVGSYEFNINVDLWLFEIDLDVFEVEFSMPGIFMNTEEPGFSFKSSDLGGNGLPGTEFLMVNREETENIVKSAVKLGKDTFTNAMKLVGTEGFTWEELSVLNKELLVWDKSAQQIKFSEEQAYKLLSTYWSLMEASAIMPLTEFMSDETDIRLPAILKATSDENGIVKFTEDSNITLTWSLDILLDMGNVVLDEAENIDITEDVFKNPETEAIVDFVLSLAKFAAENGSEFWDENGELINDVINDWVYPVLRNDNVMEAAKDAVVWCFGDEGISDEMMQIINLMPTHALLTEKLPSGHYIMLESDVPDGYFRSPLFYTINLEWNTESQDVRDWCYVTVGNLGIVLPYFAEDFYTYLREFNTAASADSILNKLTQGKTGTLIEDALSGNSDVTAATIAYMTGVIYNYMGGNKVYSSETELATALTKYLYAYGRTAQNLLVFAGNVAKEAKSVVTSEIDSDWNFYNYSTSLRTNHALRLKSVIEKVSDNIDTTGDNKINTAIKDTLQGAAARIDTTNRIVDITTAIQDKVETAVKTAAATAAKTVLKLGLQLTKSVLKLFAL